MSATSSRVGWAHSLFLAQAQVWAVVSVLAAPAGSYADWRGQAWPPPSSAMDEVSGAWADPDGDGVVNFVEYAFGRDPARPETEPLLRLNPPGADGALAFSYRVSTAAREALVRVERAESLDAGGLWMAPDGIGFVAASVDTGAGSATTQVELAATGGSSGFVRVTAEAGSTPPTAPAHVWFEAETFGGESDPGLSNDRMVWVSPGASIEKSIVVPAPGTYQLWVRKFWNPQTMRWRVGADDPWKEVSRDTPVMDLVLLSGDAGRRVGWFNAGPVALDAGAAVFRLEVPASATDTTAYDCFLLTREPFTPRGKLKPDDALEAEQPGWFAFQAANDPFGHSPIDLRHLNETVAGDRGWIQVQGDRFEHGATGQPVRFWAVNVGGGVAGLARSEVDLLARGLAKRGVNLVRYHGPVYVASGPNFGAMDPARVERVQYLVAALKREGIYTCLSIYFPLWVRLDGSNPEFPGYTGGHPFALPYYSEAFQAVYRSWWQNLLTGVNPHTGLALKDDPAVAMLELINEDSTLFWTFNPQSGAGGNLPDPQRAVLEKQLGDWLLERHAPRTLGEIRSQIWGGLSTPQDEFAAGRVGFRPLWNIANDRTRRDQETAEFLTGLMRRFYRESYDYVKRDLGYRGLIYASNWRTASAQVLDPLDKYANAVADFFDRHGYLGGHHDGPDAAWSVKAGQTYDDRAAVKFEAPAGAGENFDNPLFDLIYDGRPSTITEVNWPLPNRYRADMVPLGAIYGALQGTDALFWFAAGSPAWDNLPGKFSIQTPVVQGQFPAAAFLYRQGLVRTGPLVVDIELGVPDLFALKGTPVPAPQNFDQLRADDIPPGGVLTNVSAIDTLAFTVGRVGARFVGHSAPESRITDLSPYLDREAKLSRSATGELTWDYGRGLVTIHAPAAQGATGFLGAAGRIELPDATVESPMEYGSVLLVALDERPIAESAKLLLQVMSEEQPYRWETDLPDGVRTLLNAGEAPVMVRDLAGVVTLGRADIADLVVSPLDANGYRIPDAHYGGGTVTIEPDRFYYLIERQPPGR